MLTRLVRILAGIGGPGRAWGTLFARRARCSRAPRIALALAIALVGASAALAAPTAPAVHGDAAAPAAHEGGHGGEINPLDFKADLAIWTALVFLLLLLVLGKFAWRPIVDALEKREKRVEEQIASAEQANVDARKILAEYQTRLSQAEAEVRAILERGRREAEDLGRQMLNQTREESRHEKERALREIDAAAAGALKELAERSADLAVELAGKIVQTKMDRAEHAKLIEQAVAGFAKAPSGKN
jgi:F-type H+-transporting ATPase subunit b